MKATLWVVLALSLCAPGFAQEAAERPKKEISEKTSSGFPKLQPLIEAKDYPAALVIVDQLLAGAPPASYDVYVLSQIKTQILLTQNKLVEAIAPLEAAYRLASGNPNFFDAAAQLEQLNLLAQLHYQAGAEQKTPDGQRAAYERAFGHLARWLALSPRPSADVRGLAATLLYNLATLDADKPDAARLREAVNHAREGLLLNVNPGTQLPLLLVACHQQLGENTRAAEILELVAARDPKSASTWSQLQSLYLAMGQETKDPAEARAHNLRALLTLERAQAHGHPASPNDHYARVAIHYNLHQFTRAAALLEKGLADGTLEKTKRNWELLAASYQQTSQDAKALDAMARAVKAFPEDAALELALAQSLYNTGEVADAYARGQSALGKPGLEKPGQARLYLAFWAYELQRYDEAAKWVAAARAADDVDAARLEPLDRAIADALAAREALKKSAS